MSQIKEIPKPVLTLETIMAIAKEQGYVLDDWHPVSSKLPKPEDFEPIV